MTIDQLNKVADEISGVQFELLSDHDVLALSNIEITRPRSFDENGQIAEGGLYDLRLGAQKSEYCKTCFSSYFNCRGHFGHIRLPLPVYNPFLIRLAHQLLDMTCAECHRFVLRPLEADLLLLQLNLVDYDLQHFNHLVSELAAQYLNPNDTGDMSEVEILDEFQAKLNDANITTVLKERMQSPQLYKLNSSRTLVERKYNLIKEFMRRRPLSFIKECNYCKRRRIAYVLNSCTTIQVTSKEANLVSDDGAEQGRPDPLLARKIYERFDKSRRVVNPLGVRAIFRGLWVNEKQLLNRILPFLLQMEKDVPNVDNEPTSLTDAGSMVRDELMESDPTACVLLDTNLLGSPCPLDIFFNQCVLVTSTKFRPLRYMNGRYFEDSKSSKLSAVINSGASLRKVFQTLMDSDKQQLEVDTTSGKAGRRKSTSKKTSELASREAATDLFYRFWTELQISVNSLFDAELAPKRSSRAQALPGIKQLIEKKEGLFRKNMMGKRVNYAARSVISPDPYIMVDEIGFPEIFAKRLSFPEPVNDMNYEQLSQLVQNGPDIYPGALSVVMENGNVVRLNAKDANQRETIAQSVLVNVTGRANPDLRIKIVNRHLRNGDVLLINRQPTLHKPSIMAHRARVLPGEKTIRLHYANCKCYNADFDGDEMNAHFPQSFLTRAEGYNIVSVNYQYLVPKDGTPLSGLIQDHIVAATMLTYRGQFLNRIDYQNLVYAAISFINRPIRFLPPVILKPVQLWSGKQVASTIILNLIPDGKQPPTLQIASKLKPSILTQQTPRRFTVGGKIEANELCESQVIIQRGHLLVGVFDKSNLGNTSYGLVHTCYELYGGKISSALLTAFARLANTYLQSICGFTLGIYDILLTEEAEEHRSKLIEQSTQVGDEAVADAFNIVDPTDKDTIVDEFQDAHTSANQLFMKMLDASVKSKTDEINNSISKKCLPAGLLKPFPYNHLQMMIQPGAKGGLVNALQISCLLGQIELEGKRVPLMISGKTLPSFKAYETAPKAGGFVTGRFLTGIRPQEFFFHCMAGREGLIDTAVKTSRSGYLQRCLIKHLEGLVVNYDSTVRDSDQTVIQFLYGEDGLDILKSQLLKPKAISLLAKNINSLKMAKDDLKRLKKCTDKETFKSQANAIYDWQQVNGEDRLIKKRGTAYPEFYARQMQALEADGSINDPEIMRMAKQKIEQSWYGLSAEDRRKLNSYCTACPDPVCFRLNPGRHFGTLSEQMEELMDNYLYGNPDGLLKESKKRDGMETDEAYDNRITRKEFRNVFYSHYLRSLCEPGEAVGLLAAQSIGEPSTQMTLNTFHFAGRGEMNVTLGIPRLREILMTASPNISTPSMDIPIRRDLPEDEVEHLADQVRIQLTSITLADVLEYVDIVDTYEVTPHRCAHVFKIKFKFLRRRYFKHKYSITSSAILQYFEQKFLKAFGKVLKRKVDIQKKSLSLLDISSVSAKLVRADAKGGDGDDEEQGAMEGQAGLLNRIGDEDDDDSDDENGDGDADDIRNRGSRDQEMTYEEPEDEEKEQSESENEGDQDENEKADGDNVGQKRKMLEDELAEAMNDAEQVDENDNLDGEHGERRRDVQSQLPGFSSYFQDYTYDAKKEQWCTLTLAFGISEARIDFASIIQEEAQKSVMYKIGKIEKAFLVKNSNAKQGEFDKLIKTEGVSFLSLIKFANILDLNRIYSNDIHAIANTYGIEAGRQVIIKEMVSVFGMYGIEIDPRHLNLIADYMTSTGTIKGMNRQSMLTNASPIQQITFETSMNFIKNATLLGIKDQVSSPSSRIFVGRPVTAGSGLPTCVMRPITTIDRSQQKHSSLRQKQVQDSGRKRKYLNVTSPNIKKFKLENE